MTIRLYRNDQYKRTFLARVVEQVEFDGRTMVNLDRTCFYPGGGGQPVDFGHLNGVAVVDVLVDEEGRIFHVVEASITDSVVEGTIDWHRRFDHMQQHTGQHILSQAFIAVVDAPTSSFHLGSKDSTIDIDDDTLTQEDIAKVEHLANTIVWSNLYVVPYYVSLEEAKTLKLRSLPELTTEKIRLVEIGDYDLTACGGTHVAQTGEVGMIKISGTEQRGDKIRISFLCGARALGDYVAKDQVIKNLSGEFTTGFWELESSVERLRENAKANHKAVQELKQRLLRYEIDELRALADDRNGVAVVKAIFDDRDPAELKQLANLLTESEPTIAMLAVVQPKMRMIFARSESAPGDMNRLIKVALSEFDSASGGGTSSFAQGGGEQTSRDLLSLALEKTAGQLPGE